MAGRLTAAVVAGLVAAACAVGAASSARAAGAAGEADVLLIAHVAERIFAEAAPPEGMLWPPRVVIAHREDVIAYASFADARGGAAVLAPGEGAELTSIPLAPPSPATGARLRRADASPAAAPSAQPVIVLTQGLLDQVVQGSADRLAAVLAHETARLVLSHALAQPSGAPPAPPSDCRSPDAEAVMLGMKLGLRADFSYKRLVAGHAAMGRHNAPASATDSAQTAPSADRVALIESRQSELWPSIPALEYGTYFLALERYALAESCFRQVAAECPQCYPAWANLGYAQLMQYCDRLEPENLQDLDLGVLAVGGFYRRPDALEGTTRGLGPEIVELWFDAVGSLRQAIILQPELALAKANLAAAYLMGPEGKDVARARALFGEARAARAQRVDEPLDPRAHAALLVNAGVAELAAGNSAAAEELFAEAQSLCDAAGDRAGTTTTAIHYNRARHLAASIDDADRRRGVLEFETYLRTASSASTWWPMAYDQYDRLCDEMGVAARAQSELRAAADAQPVRVAGIMLPGGATLDLGARLAALARWLPGGQSRTLVHRSNIRRISDDELGVEVLGGEWIGAIRLRDAGAAVLISNSDIREAGEAHDSPAAAPHDALRCGMTLAELDRALGDEATRWRPCAKAPHAVDRYYPRLGLGVRIWDGQVAEMIVASPAIKLARD